MTDENFIYFDGVKNIRSTFRISCDGKNKFQAAESDSAAMMEEGAVLASLQQPLLLLLLVGTVAGHLVTHAAAATRSSHHRYLTPSQALLLGEPTKTKPVLRIRIRDPRSGIRDPNPG
jgi:hypothetical protein